MAWTLLRAGLYPWAHVARGVFNALVEIASVGPWRIVPRAKIAKRGELACRLRGAAPSLAKELQGAVGEDTRSVMSDFL